MLKIIFLLAITVYSINGSTDGSTKGSTDGSTKSSTKLYKEPTHPEFLRIEKLRAQRLVGVSHFQPYLESITLPPDHKMEMNVTSNFSLVSGPIIHDGDLMNTPGFTWPCNASDYHTFFLTRNMLNFTYWGYEEYHLWVVVNIPGNEIHKGEELFPYIPPAIWRHPKNKFCPVYRAVAYRQPGFIQLPRTFWFLLPRTFTTVTNFTQKYGMKEPLAAIDFYVDDLSNKTKIGIVAYRELLIYRSSVSEEHVTFFIIYNHLGTLDMQSFNRLAMNFSYSISSQIHKQVIKRRTIHSNAIIEVDTYTIDDT